MSSGEGSTLPTHNLELLLVVLLAAVPVCFNPDNTVSLRYLYLQVSDSDIYPGVPFIEASCGPAPTQVWALFRSPSSVRLSFGS